jgi:hypothetical protein
MPNDFPLFRSLLVIAFFIAVVGAAGSWATGDGAPWEWRGGEGGRADVGRAAAPAAAVAAALPAAAPDTAAGVCRVEVQRVALPDAVHESSGVAAAGGALWTHNDSGDPVLFALSPGGVARGQVRVTGARVTDWEDLAAGPCAAGRCLFVADIGDNQAARPGITVYRVPAPAPGDAATRPAEALNATYPGGPQDAEAIFVTPDGRVHVVTKGETGPVAVYRFPADARPGPPVRLERVRVLAGEQGKRRERITGAAASPDGRWVVLRTLRDLAFYRTPQLLDGAPGEPVTYDLTPLGEAQGEAVAWEDAGTLHLTSEGGSKKNPATLARLACTLPA